MIIGGAVAFLLRLKENVLQILELNFLKTFIENKLNIKPPKNDDSKPFVGVLRFLIYIKADYCFKEGN